MSAPLWKSATVSQPYMDWKKCMANELLEFEGGIYAMALNLEEDSVGAVMLGPDEDIKEGGYR